MERKFFKILIIALSLSVMSTQCSSDDDDGTQNDNSVQIAELTSISIDGTWRVQSYMDSGQDETSDFNGYSFIFNSSGDITATSQTATRTGTWSITNDSNSSSDDDGDDSDIDFNIMFAVTSADDDFEDLNDDWDVLSYSNTQIQLRDVSGGDGSVDTLTFVKN